MRVFCLNENGQRIEELLTMQNMKQLLVEYSKNVLLFVADANKLDNELIEKMYNVISCSEHHGFVCLQNDEKVDNYIIMDELQGEVVLCCTKYLSMLLPRDNMQITFEDIYELSQKAVSYGIQTVGVYSDNEVANICRKKMESNRVYVADKKPSILFYIRSLPNKYNGSIVHTLGELDGLVNKVKGKYSITICHGGIDTVFWGLDEKYPGIRIVPVDQIEEVYDIAVLPTHTVDYKAQYILSRHALRWIVWPLDIIVLRRAGVFKSKTERLIKGLLENADSMIVSSQSVAIDIDSYWPNSEIIHKSEKEVISLPSMIFSEYDIKKCRAECPFEKFILIFGNTILHKMINPLVSHITSEKYNFIVVGWNREEYISSNIYGYASGKISEEYISFLYQECEFMIFPSLYEGFGLPVINALNSGKEVLTQETYVNKEIGDLVPEFSEHIHYFYSFDNINKKIEEVYEQRKHFHKGLYLKTWDDVGEQMVNVADRLMEKNARNLKHINRLMFYKKNNEYYRESVIEERDGFVNRLVEEGIFCDLHDMKIVIYGFGVVGKLLAKELKKRNLLVRILDAKPRLDSWEGIPISNIEQYTAEEEHKIIITPVQDFLSIRDKLIELCETTTDQIIHLNDFLSNRIITN